jgi:hypothetical protein
MPSSAHWLVNSYRKKNRRRRRRAVGMPKPKRASQQQRQEKTQSISKADDGWTELVPPHFPEGDFVGVYCNFCSTKNRQDMGWRYRSNHSVAAAAQRLQRLMPDIANLEYQCDDCRPR